MKDKIYSILEKYGIDEPKASAITEDLLVLCDVSQQSELLAAFVKDWYKDNPMVDETKQLRMVDKFLAAYSG